MSFLESLSKRLGFTVDEDDDRSEELEENELQDEDEEEEEESSRLTSRFPQVGFFNFKQKRSAKSSEEQEEEENDAEYEEPAPHRSSRRGNVIHDSRMDPRAAEEPQFTHFERIINVRQIEECREIIRYFHKGESIMLNMENIDPKDCGRVIDLLSGAAFALQGRMIKIAHLSYLLAPENVKVIEEDIYAAGQVRYR